MAMKDRIDVQTGSKLRRLSRIDRKTAEELFKLMQAQREQDKPEPDATPSASAEDVAKHRGPARLASPFEGLSL